jgi:hypothetical protein
MVDHVFKKFYSNFKGIDLRSPDISQNPDAAVSMINGSFRQSGSLSKRKGYQFCAPNEKGGYGVTVFENVNSSGVATNELLTIDQNLFKLSSDSFTITYAPGDSTTGRYDLYFDSSDSTFYFDVYDGTSTRVLHYDIGNGYSGTNRTVANVVTQINALTDFTATSPTTAGSQNAAFIPVARSVSLADGTAVTIGFQYYAQVSTPSTYSNPFSTFYAARTSSSFENASFAQLKQVLYIATGYDALHKYDGLRVYKAGLPVPTAPTDSVSGAGGSLTAGVYKWKYTYIYKDAKGNEIESTPSDTCDFTSAGADTRTITLTNLQETSGYNVDQAKVNGLQATVNTITVDSGYGLKIGDYVYLQDAISGGVVSRKVTALPSSTQITINGNAVTVADNAVISCIKQALYRTESGGTIYYLSKELTNDIDNNTQTHADGLADNSLGAEFIEPIKPHGLPPTCRYVRPWRSQLVLAGDPTSTNTVYYSDIESPEYFPPADNSFTVSNTVTGIKELDSNLFVFKEKSIDAVSGDFGTDVFEVDNVSNEKIGCVANGTIQEINRRIWFLGKDGVYTISPQEGIVELTAPIKPRFTNVTLNVKQSTAFNYNKTMEYVLFIPSLTNNSPAYASDSASKVYVYNYFDRHNAWHEWTNFNMLGGAVELEEEAYVIRRSQPSATLYTHTQRIQETGGADDYLDHDQAIAFSYTTPWESFGEPAIPKKFLRIKIYSIDPTIDDFECTGFDLTTTVYGNFLNVELGSADLDFSGGAIGWGAFEWGSVPWGELQLPDLGTKLSGKKLKSQQLKFSNSEFHQNVLIAAYELEVAAPFRPGFKD